MTRHLRYAAALAALAIAAACGKPTGSALSDDLQRDLDQAGGSGIELAPSASARTQVVSAEEQGRVERRRSAAPRPTSNAARAVPVARTSSAPEPRVPTSAPADPPTTVEAAPPPAPAGPRPQPNVPTQQRRGGYKSVGDVIRDAPFPINP